MIEINNSLIEEFHEETSLGALEQEDLASIPPTSKLTLNLGYNQLEFVSLSLCLCVCFSKFVSLSKGALASYQCPDKTDLELKLN